MLTQTKGIVLRQVKYKESSLILDIYTEIAGLQSFVVHGVRSSRSRAKANYFNLMNILDIECRMRPDRRIHTIREFSFAHKYTNLSVDFIKANIGLFMCELVLKSIRQQESDGALFDFFESALTYLDSSSLSVANLPIFFALRLCHFLGFGISDQYDEDVPFFDLRQGEFMPSLENKRYCLRPLLSQFLSQINEAELENVHSIPLNRTFRRDLLHSISNYYRYHVDGFTPLNTIDVLHEVFE